MAAYYNYRVPIWLGVLELVLAIIGVTAIIKNYYYDNHNQNLFNFVNLMFFLTIVLDPTRFALRTTKTLPDGSEVRVKKPIIALRRYEKTMASFPGVADGALPDEWQFERAYLRI